jgi:Domain of unknown function (DUF4129)
MRTALVGSTLFALLVLVAVGSTGDRWGGGLEDRDVPRAFVDYAYTVGILVLLVWAGVVVWALTLRSAGWFPQRPRLSFVRTLGFLLAVTAFIALSDAEFFRDPGGEGASQAPAQPTVREAPDEVEAAPGPQFQWWVAAASLLALAAFVLYERRRRRERPRETASDELEAVLTQTLDELDLDADPRRAVIQAYVRMEAVLGAHGHGRRPHEAPLEYLARVLRELDVRPSAAHALTELFERARFSTHEIDLAMRAEAIASLEAVRDDLRAAA